MLPILVAGVVALMSLFIHHQYFRKKNAFPKLPPGPKPLPILGNILDLPPAGTPEFQHWLKFKDLYGPISLINSPKANYDPPQRQAGSGRHSQQDVVEDLQPSKVCFRARAVWLPKLHARQIVPPNVPTASETHASASRHERNRRTVLRRLLKRILDDPNDIVKHFKIEAAAMTLKIVYGYSIDREAADPLVELIDKMMTNFFRSHVDLRPALNHDTVNVPYSFVERQMAKGTHRPSMVSDLIERYSSTEPQNGGLDHDMEDAIKWATGIMYGGGSDTTVAALSAFMIAIILFPDFEDQERLPYTSAFVKKVLQWYGLLPISTAHCGGSITIRKHTTTLSFLSPERFLERRNEPDPDEAFGWGRRVCPGRYISDDNRFVTIARILAVFTITKKLDEQGNPIEPQVGYTAGLVAHPRTFPSTVITVRSGKHEELIRSVDMDHPWEKSDADLLEF
ncbi:O-methylsterigmatocystin oxidoreductase [Trichoderma ghanense]|uniref:O-methylsterigmatocystin oxidoreductase n=1 Tax=Trichoderma ghanense TaxID=65468 RepID=A0ABY2HDI8_9HYPO